MSRIGGDDLQAVDFETLSDDDRRTILSQLRNFAEQLRAVPPPQSQRICSIIGGPVFDHRICTSGPYGPYDDEAQMNIQIRRLTLEECQRYLSAEENDLLSRADAIRHSLRFTHGDIAPRNIMVREGKISALIDWECAGWFPEHWEYLKALYAAPSWDRIPQWIASIPHFLHPYDLEVKADKTFAWGLPQPEYVFEPPPNVSSISHPDFPLVEL